MDRDEIQTEIQMLKNRLAADTSDIGDYRVVKIYEARLKAEPDPYNADTLLTERQSVRDKINELQKELEEITDGAEGNSK